MAIQKIELSAALNSLATQTDIDKVTGMLGTSAANISKADLATVVAGLLNPLTYKGWTSDINANDLQIGIVYGGARLTNFPVASSCYIVTIGTNDRVQFAFPVSTTALYMRITRSGSWIEWKQVQFVS